MLDLKDAIITYAQFSGSVLRGSAQSGINHFSFEKDLGFGNDPNLSDKEMAQKVVEATGCQSVDWQPVVSPKGCVLKCGLPDREPTLRVFLNLALQGGNEELHRWWGIAQEYLLEEGRDKLTGYHILKEVANLAAGDLAEMEGQGPMVSVEIEDLEDKLRIVLRWDGTWTEGRWVQWDIHEGQDHRTIRCQWDTGTGKPSTFLGDILSEYAVSQRETPHSTFGQ